MLDFALRRLDLRYGGHICAREATFSLWKPHWLQELPLIFTRIFEQLRAGADDELLQPGRGEQAPATYEKRMNGSGASPRMLLIQAA